MANDPSEKIPPASAEGAPTEGVPTEGVPTEGQPASGVPAASAPPVAAKPAAPSAKPEGAAPPAPAKAAPPAAAAVPPKPAPAKEPSLKPVPLENDLVHRLKSRFGEAIREAWLDRKQAIVVIEPRYLRDIAFYCRDEEDFAMLADLTAVDWPKREKRFDIVLNLYSFGKNERLRLKAQAGDGEAVPSVVSVWAAANWLEREAFDMFGLVFDGHPDLRRILLPEEWQGYPLRKDYDILRQDRDWVRENLGIESGQ